MSIIAILTAGGTGTRTHQDLPKQFITVENKPIIIYTLEAFQQHPSIDEIYVSYNVGHDDVVTIKEMAEIYADAGSVALTATEPTKDEVRAFNPMRNSALDNSKLKKLGYKDTFSVDEGLRHTVEILKEIAWDHD